MYRPLPLFMGLRYLRAKRRNHFVSFIAVASMIGIALGVAVLITVLSVMNGFDREIQGRIFKMVPSITVSSTTGYIANGSAVQTLLKPYPDIQASAPFATGEVLLSEGGSVQPALLMGIIPAAEKRVLTGITHLEEGELAALKPKQFGIVLGNTLAHSLGVSLGDRVTVITPEVSISPIGVMPRFKRFTVVGIFNPGSGFGFDKGLAFVHLQDAQTLLGLKSNITGLHLRVKDDFEAPHIARQLSYTLTGNAVVTSWADEFGEFFHAMKLEKNMMFLILLLIIAVATFNLVSTLVMAVNDKQSDIAILRTYGATPGTIMLTFIVQGGCIGILGTLLGIAGGLLLATHVTGVVDWIQSTFHVQFLSPDAYLVDYLPSHVEWQDVLKISLASIILSLLATLYPAWHAAQLDPVESLRYE